MAGLSGCHGGQLDDWIIAQTRDRFQAHVSAALNCPLIILFEQQRADEPRDSIFVGEDADDISAPLDLAIEAFDRIDGVDFRPMIFRKAHERENVGLGLVHEGGELRHFGTQLIGYLAPLLARGLGVVLHEGRADEGCDDTTALAAGIRQGVAHEVHATALPCGVQHFGDGRLDAFMGIRDHQLDAAQTAPGELAQELRPEGLGFRRSDIQRPSLLTPTATITATETMRPLSRAFT